MADVKREPPSPEKVVARARCGRRHYALNWLYGYAPDWDHTRTET
jgi:hypothetical protein